MKKQVNLLIFTSVLRSCLFALLISLFLVKHLPAQVQDSVTGNRPSKVTHTPTLPVHPVSVIIETFPGESRPLAGHGILCSRDGTQNYLLVAVSSTGDPAGTWYQYSFAVPFMPDYPKYGIWRDGYYCGVNNELN